MIGRLPGKRGLASQCGAAVARDDIATIPILGERRRWNGREGAAVDTDLHLRAIPSRRVHFETVAMAESERGPAGLGDRQFRARQVAGHRMANFRSILVHNPAAGLVRPRGIKCLGSCHTEAAIGGIERLREKRIQCDDERLIRGLLRYL